MNLATAQSSSFVLSLKPNEMDKSSCSTYVVSGRIGVDAHGSNGDSSKSTGASQNALFLDMASWLPVLATLHDLQLN